MPQLSLYLDAETIQEIKNAASNSDLSVSKWIRTRILSSPKKDWPENYFDLFGSITEESFEEPADA